MSSRTDRLLCCAVAYANAETKETPIPNINSNSSVEDVIQSMMNVLWYEAKQTMTESMTDIPSDPYLHAVDVDSGEPGIVSSKGKLDIHRRKLPVPNISYNHRKPIKLYNIFETQPDITYDEALKKAEKDVSKIIKKSQKTALKEIDNENKSLEKIDKRETEKKKRQEETPEERQTRLTEMREKKKRKKEENEKIIEEEKQHNISEKKSDSDLTQIEVQKDLTTQDEEKDLTNVAVNIQELLESEAAADHPCHSLLPSRIKAKNIRKTKFHPSPVPFDRHLLALEAAWPADHIKDVLFSFKPDEHVQVIQGPPGTGKTSELISYIEQFPNKRIFVCAGTNVGAANLYTRIIKKQITCSLLMPQSRIPPGTPITSQDPSCRIVCSTISGRSGPILDSENFDVLLVDEAAQCMEAWFWGLIRPEVEHIIMVGDTEQLPALVSEKGQKLGHDRSLMQRLIENKYPYRLLQTQRRMHSEIIKYPNKIFYNNKLKTEYTPYNLNETPYSMLNVKGKCEEIGTSFVNIIEGNICIQKALDLKKQTDDVVILCPYQAQARHLLSLGSNIQIHTIDSFQGREADCVILSIVRTNTSGFWTDQRRLCVALTRAKHVLCIVGNCEEWTGNLHDLYLDAKERDVIIKT